MHPHCKKKNRGRKGLFTGSRPATEIFLFPRAKKKGPSSGKRERNVFGSSAAGECAEALGKGGRFSLSRANISYPEREGSESSGQEEAGLPIGKEETSSSLVTRLLRRRKGMEKPSHPKKGEDGSTLGEKGGRPRQRKKKKTKTVAGAASSTLTQRGK